MSPPSCCHAAAAQHCCHHRCCCAAAATTMLPCCCHYPAATATQLPLPRCWLRRGVATKLLPLPLPPHHRHHSRCCQAAAAAAAAAKLPPLPLSTLWDSFDNEIEFCKMTDVDFFQISRLFQPGIKFLHGGMLSIFDALVYLSLNHIHL